MAITEQWDLYIEVIELWEQAVILADALNRRAAEYARFLEDEGSSAPAGRARAELDALDEAVSLLREADRKLHGVLFS